MFYFLEAQLLALIQTVPLEVFVCVASFIEEVIAPIPSPTVMVASGSFAALQGYTVSSLILLACIGALGKTLGALVVYFITFKLEGVIIEKFGRFFGITMSDIDRFGTKLTGGVRDYVILTFFRALPIMPSSLVSVGCGLLKVPLPLFIVSTFLGTIVRDSVYLYAGFVGTTALTDFIAHSTALESWVQLGIVMLMGALFIYVIYKRKKRLGDTKTFQ
jgi:membrane protein DedA with SNARE-associated domain